MIGAVPSAFEAKQLDGYTWAVLGALGTTTPSTGAFATLSSTYCGASPALTVNQSGAGVLADIQKSGTSKLTIDTNGNVGIRTTAPVGHASSRKALILSDTANDALFEVWGSAGGKVFFQSVAGNAYMGSLAMGSGAGNLYLAYGDGSDGLIINGANGVVGIPTLAGSGNRAVYSDAGGLTNSSSDIRLKTDITNLSDGLNILSVLGKLRGIYYNWDTSIDAAKDLGSQREIGMVAQEVQAVLPELVGQNASGYLSLDYPKLSVFLVEVVKNQ